MVVTLRKYKTHNTGWIKCGCHYARRKPTLHHEIRINDSLLAHHANSVLWHELAHAMQAERWVRDFKARNPNSNGIKLVSIANFYAEAYLKAKGPHGASYWLNHYEVEAVAIADDYAFTMEGRLIIEREKK